jgi:hypothetical protein
LNSESMNKAFYLIIFGLYLCFSNCKRPMNETPGEPDQPQRDIGGLQIARGLHYQAETATPGYVLFSPLLSSTTYLISTTGEVVHTWESQYGPSGWVYLAENGHLMRGGRDPQAKVFGGGGAGGWLQEFSWDGDLIWEYHFANEEHLAHHDVAIMPNGNILVLAWEAKTPEEAIRAGRKPGMIPEAGLWPDMIAEIKPLENHGAEIVWKWHIWDHLIQHFDPSKDHYGDPSLHPELLDINLGHSLPPAKTQEELDQEKAKNNAVTNDTPENQGSDVFHMNAIDYHPDLDQIVISSPSLNEIFVIDHSTSTDEAAGHRGGRWGKGGDFLYRWGNPQNYGRGDSTRQELGAQHDVKWILEGFPGEGHLMVFNNQVPMTKPPYSSVIELIPPLQESGYALTGNDPFGPEKPNWAYIARDTLSFFAPFISGAHRMMNGNTFITEGPKGRFFEVNPDGEILWDYLTPYSGDVRMPDGTGPQPVGPFIYATFRATHISIDHPAVKGKTLQPLSPQPEAFVPPAPSQE